MALNQFEVANEMMAPWRFAAKNAFLPEKLAWRGYKRSRKELGKFQRYLGRKSSLEGDFWDWKRFGGRTSFSGRTPWQHLKMGVPRTIQSMVSPGIVASSIAFGAFSALSGTENGRLLDPYSGVTEPFIENLALASGGALGGAVGAAIGGAILPVVGAWAGYAVGMFVGSDLARSAVNIPFAMAKKGRELRQSGWMGSKGKKALFEQNQAYNWQPFNESANMPLNAAANVQSEAAVTMRQRAMQMCYQSQLNARSALGMEAMSYHN